MPRGALLGEGESQVFSVVQEGREREAFVLRRGGQWFAYLNECPHWTVELDLGDGHFFDPELDRIYCKNHGALFFVDSGICETGPCLGRFLERFWVRAEGEDLIVEVP